MTISTHASSGASTSGAARTRANVLKTARPELAEPRSWNYPEVTRRTLPTGLELACCHCPGRPFAVANLVFQYGAVDEPSHLSGVTKLMAGHLGQATERYGYVELGLALERLGTGIGTGAGTHTVGVGISGPTWAFTDAFEILLEIVQRPAFPPEELDKSLAAMRVGLAQRLHHPGMLAGWSLTEAVFTDDTIYNRDTSGTWESIEILNRDTLLASYHDMLASASATLTFAGDLDAIDIDALAMSIGDSWPPRDTDADPIVQARDGGRQIIVVDRPGSPQSIVNLGHIGPPRQIPDHVPLGTFLHAFGGHGQSRLSRVLREEKGYTYGVGAGLTRWRHGGMFTIGTSVQIDATAATVGELVTQVTEARDTGLSADEVEWSREAMLGAFPLGHQDVGGLSALLGAIVEDDLPLDVLADTYEALVGHTVDDVNAAAARYLLPDELKIVVVGDAATVAPELEALGVGPVEVRQPVDIFPPPPVSATAA